MTLKAIDFWFDPISPFAYLAFERLPQVLEGCSVVVTYRPVLLAGLLAHWGQKGPAEIEPKRAWTFRHLHWWAREQGIALQTPAVHPFNPLPLLRLAIACGPNRRVVEALMQHVWHSADDAVDTSRLAELTTQLAPTRDPASVEVKAELRAATEDGIARGIFGVPTFGLDGRLFWGLDALPMLRAAVRDEPWFEGPGWDVAGAPRPGIQR